MKEKLKAFIKKPISMVLAVAIVISCITVGVIAASSITVGFGTKWYYSDGTEFKEGSIAKPGDKVKVDVLVSSESTFGYLKIPIKYNKEKLTLDMGNEEYISSKDKNGWTLGESQYLYWAYDTLASIESATGGAYTAPDAAKYGVLFLDDTYKPNEKSGNNRAFLTLKFVVNEEVTVDDVGLVEVEVDAIATKQQKSALKDAYKAKYGSTLKIPSIATKIMFTIGGEDSNTTDVEITENYEYLTFKGYVAFDTNGKGEFSDKSTVRTDGGLVGTTVTAPSDVTAQAGWNFIGWSEKKDATAPDNTAITYGYNAESSPATYYAVYEGEEYDLTFSYDGDTPTDAPDVSTYNNDAKYKDVAYESVVNLPSPTTAEEGWSFKGWNDGTSALAAGASYKVVGDASFTGTWEYQAPEYTFKYVGFNGETIYEKKGPAGTALDVPNAPAATGYDVKWSDEATEIYKVDGAKDGDTYEIKPVKTALEYTITFDSKGGSAVADITGVKYDATPKKPADPTKKNFSFVKWVYAGTENEYTFGKMSDTGVYTATVNLEAVWEDAPVTLTFKYNDGKTVTVSGVAGETIPADKIPALPTEDGYDFAWKNLPDTFPTEDTEITIEKTEKTYSVVFDTNGSETTIDPINNVKYTGLVTEPTAPAAPANKTFAGWYTSADKKFDFSKNLKDNGLTYAETLTLKAKWTDVVYKVTYHYTDKNASYSFLDNSTEVFSGVYGDSYTAPAAPTQEGYSIAWDTALNKIPNKDTDIYLVVTEKSYTIKFNTNGGTEIADVTAKYTETVSAPETTKTGYELAGWLVKGTTTVFKFPYTMSPKTYKETIELEAQWTAKTYTVKFIVDGDEYDTKTGRYGESFDMPEAPAYDGYETSWSPASIDIYNTDDVTVTLVKSAKSFSITFDEDGGTPVDEGSYTNVKFDAVVASPSTTKEGFGFDGWYYGDTKYDFTKSCKDNGVSYSSLGEPAVLALKAKWSEKTCTITFKSTTEGDVSYEKHAGEVIDVPTPADVEGYTIVGWVNENDKDAANPEVIPADGQYVVPETEDGATITMIPRVTVNTYVVEFWANNGTEDVLVQTTTLNYGEEITTPADSQVPDRSAENLIFSGWKCDDGSAVPATVPAHNVKAVAVYVEREPDKYVLTYMTSKTRTYETYQIAEGDIIKVPANPEKFLNTFKGWDWDGDGEVDDLSVKLMPSEDHVVYAVWEKDSNYLAYILGGAAVAGGAIAGISIAATNAALITGGAIVGSGVLLTGISHLVKHTYTVNYMVDGEVYKTYKVVEGTTVPVPADPSKAGMTFKGWDNVVPGKMPANDLTFNATFGSGAAAANDDDIPATGSTAVGATAAAMLAMATAAAFVLKARKKKDEE